MMTKQFIKTLIAVALAISLFISAVPVTLAVEEDEIAFADDALKQALLTAGVDESGDGKITEGEMAIFASDLVLADLSINDITGLEFATAIPSLDLSGNSIRDISALTGLIQLTSLDVSDNFLDISDGSASMGVISGLTGAGCSVLYDPQRIPVSGVSLNKTTSKLCVGDAVTLEPTVTPSTATDRSVTWSSNKKSVATVSKGVVTAVGNGTATITATTNEGGFKANCVVTVISGTLASSVYKLDDDKISGVTKVTTPAKFIDNFDNDTGVITIYDKDGKAYKGTCVATGMTAKLKIDGILCDEATIIVDGDTNGDGMISISDYTLTRLHILSLKKLKGVYLAAGDANGDGKVSISDYTLMRLDILGLKSIGKTGPDLPYVSDSRIRAFLNIALAQQGKPYVWSEEGPDSFDCSGYVYYCLKQAGYSSVYRATANTYSKWSSWTYVDRDKLKPGDLMFYDDEDIPGRIGHIGIYLGNGYHIHASSSYGCVIICRIDGWYDEFLSHGRRVWS